MASASQIAAALADAQAKQVLADAAALEYTNKANELAALGGSPKERALQIINEIQSSVDAAKSVLPLFYPIAWAYGFNGAQSLITPVASAIAPEIEAWRVAIIAVRAAFGRYTELAAIMAAYPAAGITGLNVTNTTNSASTKYSSMLTGVSMATSASSLAAAQNSGTQAGQIELVRLRQLVSTDRNYGYTIPGIVSYADAWSYVGDYHQRLYDFSNGTDFRSTSQLLAPYYNTKTATATTATTAWNYYNSLTLDAPVLNQRTHYANGGVTVSAVPLISVFHATSPPTAGAVTFYPSGGVAVGGIASAIPHLMWQQGETVIYTYGSGGVAVGGTASIPGTTGTGGAVVITIHGTLTGGGGEAAVVLADLSRLSSTLTGTGGTGVDSGSINADLTLISSEFTEGSGGGEVTGTIEADLTLLDSTVISDDYVPPASSGTIEADLTLVDSGLLSDDYIPPDPVNGTIDEAPIPVIQADIEAFVGPYIYVIMPHIDVELRGGLVIQGNVAIDLPLILAKLEVNDNKVGRFRAKLTKLTSNIKGGFYGVRARLPLIESNLIANASGGAVINSSLGAIKAKITGNFNLAARLTKVSSTIIAKMGKVARVSASLSKLTSALSGNSAISASLPTVRSTVTAVSGGLVSITSNLTSISANLRSGNTVFGVLPKVKSAFAVRPIIYASITAKLSRATSVIDVIDYSELPSITAQLPHISTNFSDGSSGIAPVVGVVEAEIRRVDVSMYGNQGRTGIVSAKLTRMTSKVTAKQGAKSTCNAVMPGVIRAKITAKRGTRGTVSAKLKVPTSRIV